MSTDYFTAREHGAVSAEYAGFEKLLSCRTALAQQQTDNATQGTSLATMGALVPTVFHRRFEMSNKDTRHLRAVLDYVLFLQDPANAVGAIQRRKCKEPHCRKDVVKALRDVIPAVTFREVGWEKDQVDHDDVKLVVLAARQLLLDTLKNYSGQDWIGTKAFAGIVFVKEEPSKSRDGSSEDSNASSLSLTKPQSIQETTLELDTIVENPPLSALSTNTTATDQLAKFVSRPDLPLSPSRRMTLPSRETRSHRRSLSNKRSASEVRGQAVKRTKMDGVFEEETGPQTSGGRGRQRASLPTPSDDIASNFVEAAQQAKQLVDSQSSEILQLKKTLSERDSEIRKNLRATVDRQNEELAKSAKDSMEVAIQKEKQKAQAEELACCKHENAVLRALLKAKDVAEEELRQHLPNMKGF